jgi:hypothetical protein
MLQLIQEGEDAMRTEKTNWRSALLVAGILSLSATAWAQTEARQKARSVVRERLDFGARGTIQIIDSFGLIRIEGWDRPEVELNVVKVTYKSYDPQDLDKGMKELEQIKVEMTQIIESSLLAIKTTYPLSGFNRLIRGKPKAQLEYTIKVPRACHIMIKHNIGDIAITNVEGNIEATSRIGEMWLSLPKSNQYVVDARVRIGNVSSEFESTAHQEKPDEAKLQNDTASFTRHLFLRIGIGNIQIKKLKTD